MPKLLISQINVSPRIRTDLGNLAELKEDIQHHGLLQPIVVTEIKSTISNPPPKGEISPKVEQSEIGYELVAGYRRLQAVQSLGWTEIPVTIIDSPDSLTQFDMQLAENIKRKDLNPLEISEAILERKHRFEQLHGPIKSGGDHCSKEYQKSKFTGGEFAFPDFYAETAKLINKSEKYIYDMLQLKNLDPDIKEHISKRTLGYRSALEQQAERNRNARPIQKKSNPKSKTLGLPNKEDIVPMQKQYQAAPNLMKLFMLVQHTVNTITQQQDKLMEYQNCELEFLFIFIQQLDLVIPYYQEIRKQLNLMQEQKINELAASMEPTK